MASHLHILALSGSLRADSSNTRLLLAGALVAPADVQMQLSGDLAELPHFNPDQEADAPPASVLAFRDRVAAADAVVICCPEYAGGIPGTFKNALDWLVGCMALNEKPTALWSASPSSLYVMEALRRVLAFLDVRVVEPACLALPLRGSKLDARGIAETSTFGEPLRASLQALARAVPERAARRP